MNPVIVTIVEGHSEVESVPVLLRRLLGDMQAHQIQVAKPFRVKRYQVVREGELERAVRQACRSREGAAGVLVILDADDNCPAQLGPALLERCKGVTGLPVSVVLARSELEAWFLGAKESLRGTRGIRDNATAPDSPEGIRDAKGHLSQNMQDRRYLEVDDQPALAERMDFGLPSQRCPSFSRFAREVARLVEGIDAQRTTEGH